METVEPSGDSETNEETEQDTVNTVTDDTTIEAPEVETDTGTDGDGASDEGVVEDPDPVSSEGSDVTAESTATDEGVVEDPDPVSSEGNDVTAEAPATDMTI